MMKLLICWTCQLKWWLCYFGAMIRTLIFSFNLLDQCSKDNIEKESPNRNLHRIIIISTMRWFQSLIVDYANRITIQTKWFDQLNYFFQFYCCERIELTPSYRIEFIILFGIIAEFTLTEFIQSIRIDAHWPQSLKIKSDVCVCVCLCGPQSERV